MPLLPVAPPFCALAPTDPERTQLGWHFGDFRWGFGGSGIAGSRSHEALDFMADEGSPIVVPFGGFVTHATANDPAEFGDRARGFSVTLLHPPAGSGAPHFSTYLHLQGRSPLRVGQFVEAGALLGRVGTSGLHPGDRPRLELRVARATEADPWSRQNRVLDPIGWFSTLGLGVHGAQRAPGMLGGQAPLFGGHLLVRAGGPSDCPRRTGALGDLAAPPGFVDSQSSVYSQYGQSGNSSTATYEPSLRLNRNAQAMAAGGGLLALGLGAAVWWTLTRSP